MKQESHRSSVDHVSRTGVTHPETDMIYHGEPMQRVAAIIRTVAGIDAPVLVLGESGTGKELVARELHHRGRRRQAPFVSIDAGALPDTLLESELFGYRRGAFSGALEDKAGLIESADNGSLFLDEIGEASPALQARLLRFLETGCFRRLGERTERQARVRLITATHRDLPTAVENGRFRLDLYHRLAVFPIQLPPLRERTEDIPLLVRHFVEKFNQELGKTVTHIPDEVMKRMVDWPWPGNIRELRNHVLRCLAFSGDEHLVWEEPDRLMVTTAEPVRTSPPTRTLAEIERDYMKRVLEYTGGNKSEAARILGLKRGTFRARLQKHGLVGSAA